MFLIQLKYDIKLSHLLLFDIIFNDIFSGKYGDVS